VRTASAIAINLTIFLRIVWSALFHGRCFTKTTAPELVPQVPEQ
jgi:hypothetical protein